MNIKNFNIILFDDFETLDAFGPAEIIGKLPKKYALEYYSSDGGIITSSQNIKVETLPFADMNMTGIALIPGGMGTRKLTNHNAFINSLNEIAYKAEYILTVCTGSALLAKTNILNGKKATSNKMAFDWVCSQNINVNWQKNARWVSDEKIYTSSGVSAGMDMTLGFIADVHGKDTANDIAGFIEYIWNDNKENDPFAIIA